MAYNFEYPYTDMHKYNDDWLINRVKELTKNWLDTAGEWHNTQREFKELENYIKEFIVNFDLVDEVKEAIEKMAENGTLLEIIKSIVDDYKLFRNYVTPQMFGAKADARYYDVESRTWWKDSTKSETPTDDGEAIQKAIDYAIENNIHSIFFGDGCYYCPNRKFTIDTSKMRFVGENTSKLVSVGLTSGAFITLTSPLDLKMYDYARVSLENICVEGVYNNDSASTGVTGVVYGEIGNAGATIVSPHMALNNVTIKNFNVGLWLANAYKSSAYNLNVIACNYGIYVTEGGIVPWNCYGVHIECCYFAFYSTATGYAEARFFGGAFEYNRFQYNATSKTTFIGTRFEFDLLASCNKNLEAYYPFYVCGDGSPYLKLIDCSILSLPNFEMNVGNWLTNPYVMDSAPSISVLFAYSTGLTGKAQIYMERCEIATDGDTQYPSGNYYVSGNKVYANANQYYGGCTAVFNPSSLVNNTNGLLE